MYNVLGQEIYSYIDRREDGKIKIDISNFDSGLYYLIIKTDTTHYQGKFLKLQA